MSLVGELLQVVKESWLEFSSGQGAIRFLSISCVSSSALKIHAIDCSYFLALSLQYKKPLSGIFLLLSLLVVFVQHRNGHLSPSECHLISLP